MQDKIVLFLGAGFSADANIPIQSRIINEMQKQASSLSSENSAESVKFLEAFIEVGIFLLERFSNYNVTDLHKNLKLLQDVRQWQDISHNAQNDETIESFKEIILRFSNQNIREILSAVYSKKVKTSDGKDEMIAFQLFEMFQAIHYKLLVELKEKVRIALEKVNLQVDLEDVFTLFDKSYRENENWRNITYIELDKLRHSVLRLFTYYFGIRMRAFDKSKSKKYDGFVQFCKSNSISIVTTNWDTVVETLFKKNKISYQTQEEANSSVAVDLIKLHGSINWVKCNTCGKYQIKSNSAIADYLLDDKLKEQCCYCGNEARNNQIILQPEIITPTMLKTLNSKLYRDIWSIAAKELSAANRIIFVGYSLPLADFEIRYLLKKHIKTNTKIDVVLTKMDMPNKYNKTQMPENRYKSLFPTNELRFHYDGCKNFFNKDSSYKEILS